MQGPKGTVKSEFGSCFLLVAGLPPFKDTDFQALVLTLAPHLEDIMYTAYRTTRVVFSKWTASIY
jgi:hypothetical protein